MNPDSTQHRQSPWLNWLVQQRGQFILAIPVSCLIASLSAFGGLQFKTAEAENWVQHTQQVRLEGKRLLTDLLDAETGVRGYVLLRRQEFLEPYKSARISIPQSLKKLKQLVADNPPQGQRLQKVESSVIAREDTLERLIQLVNTQSPNVIQSQKLASSLLEGKRSMDRTKAEIDRFIAEEERLQIKRNQTLKQQQQLTWIVLRLSAGIGIGSSLFAAYLLKLQERQLRKRDRNLQESEAQYRLLIENFPNGGVLLFNRELRYLVADGTAIRKAGLSKEQLEGKTIWESLPPDLCSIIEPLYRQALAGESTTAEYFYGDRFYQINALPVRNESGEIFAGMVVRLDVTERKQFERKLNLLNRSLRTLSECNQVLVRATEESALLHNICRIIVEFGGYHSAWIGFGEQDEAKTVRPVAEFGFPEGYLDSLDITWSDTQQGHGPVGTVIRTGQTYISQNILTDETYAPWIDAASQRGYAASISLPLIVDDRPLGALNIYSVQPDAFSEEEVKLLTELANDIAYGITALRTQVKRQKAEAALQASNAALAARERQWRTIIDAEPECVKLTAADGTLLDMNAAGLAMIEADSLQQVIGRSVYGIVAPEYREAYIALTQRALSGEPGVLEFEITALKGTRRWMESHAVQLLDESDRVIGVLSVTRDITARNQA